jgi:hypothetical protein
MSTKSIALITGANKGIGLAIAHELGTLGLLEPTGGFFHDGHAEPLSGYSW